MPILEAPRALGMRSEARLPGGGGHGGPRPEDRGTDPLGRGLGDCGSSPRLGLVTVWGPEHLLQASVWGEGRPEPTRNWLPGFLETPEQPLLPSPRKPELRCPPAPRALFWAGAQREAWSCDLVLRQVHLTGAAAPFPAQRLRGGEADEGR